MAYFGIVVVTYNAENSIKSTIESILSQSFEDYEIIVKDACSKDATLTSIPHNSKIRVESCKDTGIYDGMNQAINLVKGKYVCFLNSGDSFHDSDTLLNVHEFLANRNLDMAYGNWVKDALVVKAPNNLSLGFLYRSPLCHQAIFYKGELIKQLNGYCTEFGICADYDLTLKLFFAKKKIQHIDYTICYYEGGGVSEQKINSKLVSSEFSAVRKRHFSRNQCLKEEIKWRLTFPGLRILLLSKIKNKTFLRMYARIKNSVNSK